MRFVVAVAVALVLSCFVSAGCQHDEPAYVRQVRALVDRACACRDADCIEAVATDAAVLSYEADGEMAKLESDDLRRVRKLSDRFIECVDRALDARN